MSESGHTQKGIHEVNRGQAIAAQKAWFDAVAGDIFRIEFTEPANLGPDDRRKIQQHKDRLLSFAPELMDERFAKEVKGLISKCNEILDAPLKRMI
ncbi:MAG TPA: hypothetical protein VI957_00530 [Candidatus Paceibacterota bacterium]